MKNKTLKLIVSAMRESRFIIILCVSIASLMIATLGLNLVSFYTANEETLLTNEHNTRMDILEAQTLRGSILSSDGHVLAKSCIDQSGRVVRTYPTGELFSFALGVNDSVRGLDDMFDRYLTRSSLSFSDKMNYTNENQSIYGDVVVSTLNHALQKEAKSVLKDDKGCVIISEVDTGRILALYSNPGFDPNNSSGINNSTENINRCTDQLYDSGTMFTLISTLEFIRENSKIYDAYSYVCNGSFRRGSIHKECFNNEAHGEEDLTLTFINSCTSSYMNMGINMFKNNLAATLDRMYFMKELPIELGHSISEYSFSVDPNDIEMINAVAGLGHSMVTPIHINLITAGLANKGILMKPTFIEKVENNDGKIVRTFKNEELSDIMLGSESEAMMKLMNEFAIKSTNDIFAGCKYTVGCKTAITYEDEDSPSASWFTGYAPADSPKIAVTILVEDKGEDINYTLPLAKEIFDFYFK